MAQEASEIVGNVLRASVLLQSLLDGHLARFGLNAIRFEVLDIVDQHRQEGCSQAELASRLDQSESSISTLVDRMRKDNLLYRLRSKTDRRMRSLMLTEKGRELYTAARTGHDQRLNELLQAVDPVHVSMLNMLLKLVVGELEKQEVPVVLAPEFLPKLAVPHEEDEPGVSTEPATIAPAAGAIPAASRIDIEPSRPQTDAA